MHLQIDSERVVAEAAAKARIPLIHLSTDYVFDGSSRVPARKTTRSIRKGAMQQARRPANAP
jgi:dTDP-4-dehydrorhamnose reductase